MAVKKSGYIVLAFILFILIGCGSSSGLGSKTESFVIHKSLKDDGNVSSAEINVSLNWNYADYYATNSDITVTIGNFKITKLVCKEGDETGTLHYIGEIPSVTFKANEEAYARLSLQFQREPNDPPCSDIKYVTLSADENVTITVNGTTLTKQKKWVKVIQNPNYGKLSLENIYQAPEGKETNESGIYTYNRQLINSKIAVVEYEREFTGAMYEKTTYPFFSNIDFNETNMSVGDWILVKDDKKLAFEVIDVNNTGEFKILIDPDINKDRLKENELYTVVSTLSECTYTPEYKNDHIKFGYYCPNEENLSKIFVVEYNATDAIYTPLQSLAQY